MKDEIFLAKTSVELPSFYVSKQVTNRVEFALTTVDPNQPKFAKETMRRRLLSGINKIDLTKYEVQLEPDLDYVWAVSVIMDEEGPVEGPPHRLLTCCIAGCQPACRFLESGKLLHLSQKFEFWNFCR